MLRIVTCAPVNVNVITHFCESGMGATEEEESTTYAVESPEADAPGARPVAHSHRRRQDLRQYHHLLRTLLWRGLGKGQRADEVSQATPVRASPRQAS